MGNLSALNATTLVSSSSTTSSSTSTTSSTDELEEDKLNFLNLLLTQLENQNPLDPMDATEYTAQLVAYSQLEQQMEINEGITALTDLLSESAVTSNLSYVGETVELSTDMSVVQNDEANWAYSVEGTASEVYLTITDEDGTTVWEGEGSIASGAQTVTLDTSDLDVEYGDILYLSVNAVDSDGDSLDSDISSFVVVDGVTSEDGDTYLSSGDMTYTVSDVLKIFV